MLRRAFAGVTLLLAVITVPAHADNRTGITALKIATEFDACSTLKTDGTQFCANETWDITVNADGWTASGIGTDGAPPVLDMKATCKDGTYRATTNGGPVWIAKCELIGTAERPCFHITGGGPKEAFSKIETQQCFDIAGPACNVELDGVMIGRVGPLKGESVQALTEQKSCTVE